MLKKLLPKEQRFFNLFQDQANAIRKGLDLFKLLLSDYTRRGGLANVQRFLA